MIQSDRVEIPIFVFAIVTFYTIVFQLTFTVTKKMGKDNGHYQKIISVQPNSNDWIKIDAGLGSLEKLDKVRQMSIRQHFSKVEMLTPVDRRNFYKLWNGETGEMVFQAREGDIGCCLRTCCAV